MRRRTRPLEAAEVSKIKVTDTFDIVILGDGAVAPPPLHVDNGGIAATQPRGPHPCTEPAASPYRLAAEALSPRWATAAHTQQAHHAHGGGGAAASPAAAPPLVVSHQHRWSPLTAEYLVKWPHTPLSRLLLLHEARATEALRREIEALESSEAAFITNGEGGCGVKHVLLPSPTASQAAEAKAQSATTLIPIPQMFRFTGRMVGGEGEMGGGTANAARDDALAAEGEKGYTTEEEEDVGALLRALFPSEVVTSALPLSTAAGEGTSSNAKEVATADIKNDDVTPATSAASADDASTGIEGPTLTQPIPQRRREVLKLSAHLRQPPSALAPSAAAASSASSLNSPPRPPRAPPLFPAATAERAVDSFFCFSNSMLSEVLRRRAVYMAVSNTSAAVTAECADAAVGDLLSSAAPHSPLSSSSVSGRGGGATVATKGARAATLAGDHPSSAVPLSFAAEEAAHSVRIVRAVQHELAALERAEGRVGGRWVPVFGGEGKGGEGSPPPHFPLSLSDLQRGMYATRGGGETIDNNNNSNTATSNSNINVNSVTARRTAKSASAPKCSLTPPLPPLAATATATAVDNSVPPSSSASASIGIGLPTAAAVAQWQRWIALFERIAFVLGYDATRGIVLHQRVGPPCAVPHSASSSSAATAAPSSSSFPVPQSESVTNIVPPSVSATETKRKGAANAKVAAAAAGPPQPTDSGQPAPPPPPPPLHPTFSPHSVPSLNTIAHALPLTAAVPLRLCEAVANAIEAIVGDPSPLNTTIHSQNATRSVVEPLRCPRFVYDQWVLWRAASADAWRPWGLPLVPSYYVGTDVDGYLLPSVPGGGANAADDALLWRARATALTLDGAPLPPGACATEGGVGGRGNGAVPPPPPQYHYHNRRDVPLAARPPMAVGLSPYWFPTTYSTDRKNSDGNGSAAAVSTTSDAAPLAPLLASPAHRNAAVDFCIKAFFTPHLSETLLAAVRPREARTARQWAERYSAFAAASSASSAATTAPSAFSSSFFANSIVPSPSVVGLHPYSSSAITTTTTAAAESAASAAVAKEAEAIAKRFGADARRRYQLPAAVARRAIEAGHAFLDVLAGGGAVGAAAVADPSSPTSPLADAAAAAAAVGDGSSASPGGALANNADGSASAANADAAEAEAEAEAAAEAEDSLVFGPHFPLLRALGPLRRQLAVAAGDGSHPLPAQQRMSRLGRKRDRREEDGDDDNNCDEGGGRGLDWFGDTFDEDTANIDTSSGGCGPSSRTGNANKKSSANIFGALDRFGRNANVPFYWASVESMVGRWRSDANSAAARRRRLRRRRERRSDSAPPRHNDDGEGGSLHSSSDGDDTDNAAAGEASSPAIPSFYRRHMLGRGRGGGGGDGLDEGGGGGMDADAGEGGVFSGRAALFPHSVFSFAGTSRLEARRLAAEALERSGGIAEGDEEEETSNHMLALRLLEAAEGSVVCDANDNNDGWHGTAVATTSSFGAPSAPHHHHHHHQTAQRGTPSVESDGRLLPQSIRFWLGAGGHEHFVAKERGGNGEGEGEGASSNAEEGGNAEEKALSSAVHGFSFLGACAGFASSTSRFGEGSSGGDPKPLLVWRPSSAAATVSKKYGQAVGALGEAAAGNTAIALSALHEGRSGAGEGPGADVDAQLGTSAEDWVHSSGAAGGAPSAQFSFATLDSPPYS